MLETNILDQVRNIFQPLEARYTFHITCGGVLPAVKPSG